MSDDATTPKRKLSRGWRYGLIAAVVVIVFVGGAVAIIAVSGSGDSPSSLIDDFSRPNSKDSLGSIPDGPRWKAVLGTWGISNDAAVVTQTDATSNIAVAEMPSSRGTVTLKVNKVAAGAGLVFRYRNADSYWEMIAAPRFLTWQIYRVENGRANFVSNTGSYSAINKTTIAVHSNGSSLQFSIGGRLRKTLYDDSFANASGAGLVATGDDASEARFNTFSFDADG